MSDEAACQRYREELVALRLGEAPEVSAEELRRHLGDCPDCRGLEAALPGLAAAISAAQPSPAPGGALRLRLAVAAPAASGKAAARPSARQVWSAVAAAAAVLLAAGLLAQIFSSRPNLPSGQGASEPVATLIQIEGDSTDPALRPGILFQPGRQLSLGEGRRVRLAFRRGAEVEFVGAGALQVLAADKLRLDRGRLLASVEKGSEPFSVETGHGRVITLGTEFAVESDPGSTRVTVLEGRVRFVGAGGVGVEVAAGQSSSLAAGGAPSVPTVLSPAALAWLLPTPKPQVDLELVPAKPEMVAGQRFTAQLRVINRSAADVSLEGPYRHVPTYFLRLTDPAGRTSYLYPVVSSARPAGGPGGAGNCFTLTPGGCCQMDIEFLVTTEVPGEHRLAAVYFGALRSGSTGWSGTILESRSETVQVKAPPPSGAGRSGKAR